MGTGQRASLWYSQQWLFSILFPLPKPRHLKVFIMHAHKRQPCPLLAGLDIQDHLWTIGHLRSSSSHGWYPTQASVIWTFFTQASCHSACWAFHFYPEVFLSSRELYRKVSEYMSYKIAQRVQWNVKGLTRQCPFLATIACMILGKCIHFPESRFILYKMGKRGEVVAVGCCGDTGKMVCLVTKTLPECLCSATPSARWLGNRKANQ